MDAAQPVLLAGIGQHVDPGVLSLAAPAPFRGMWQRQLQRLSVAVRDDADAAALEGIGSTGLMEQRPWLVGELEDRRLPRPDEAIPFGALAAGGRLQRLVLRGGSVSPSVLQGCGRLTSLRICRAHVRGGGGNSSKPSVPRSLAHNLRWLSLERCILSGDAFPEALCRLSSLTSLAVLDCDLAQLPSCFSKLRWVGRSLRTPLPPTSSSPPWR